MGGLRDYHRPLLAGIKIDSKYGKPHNVRHIEGGTLTGLATRLRDFKPMLVTSLHVMAGRANDGSLRNPGRNELMFQGGSNWDKKVGEYADHVPFSFTSPNYVDVGMYEMDMGVKAEFKLHDSHHSDRIIVADTLCPQKNMSVVSVGQVTGEKTGKIVALNQSFVAGGATFSGLMQISFSRSLSSGDSGSSILYKVAEGKYRMVGILFGITAIYPNIGYAFSAELAEQELGIQFGHRKPIANAGDDQGVLPNTVVTLDGSGSKVYDGDAKYQWEQVYAGVSTEPNPAFHRVTITNPTSRKATFTMPENEQTLLFKLTVTDSYKLTSTDYVAVNLNRKPVANAGPDQEVDTGARVHLRGSAEDPDNQRLTHEWTKIWGPDVTLHNSDTLTPYFDAPNESAIFAWRLTVKDSLKAEFSHCG